jgi:site-specific DNA-methyltransferase (cytosine-N4-specific)
MPPGHSATPLYATPRGTAYLGDSLEGMEEHIEDESVSLFFTSPPFALSRTKEYGNKPADEYIDWFRDFAIVMWRKLRRDGSLVIDLGGTWCKGSPTRALDQFKLRIEVCE